MRTSLRVNWVEEVGYENILPGLDSRRYDVFAAGLWANASRAKAGSFGILSSTASLRLGVERRCGWATCR
jgi:hypothetical protein